MELLWPEVRPLGRADLLELYDSPGPYVRGGMLASLDGATSYAGRSGPLQTPGDSAVFSALRTVADAVLVGAGTARTEDYGPVRLSDEARGWRQARARGAEVPLVVLSRTLGFPDDARWLAGSRPVVVTCVRAPVAARERLAGCADVLVCGDDEVDLPAARDALRERGLERLLCEGGPALLGDVVRAGLLTELCATIAPVLVGAGDGMTAGGLAAPVELQLAHVVREQSTLLGRWRVAGRQ